MSAAPEREGKGDVGLINWVAFVPAAALVSVVPGANQILSLRNAVRHGTVDATVALLGRFTAFGILVLLAAAGLGATVTGSPVALAAVRWAGVAYLTWIGVTTLVTAVRHDREPGAAIQLQDDTRCGRWTLIRGEFLVAITNPKALLLFAAFIPQFVTVGAGGGQLAVLGMAYIGIEAISALGYTLVGGRIGGAQLSRRAERRLESGTGISFLAVAVLLVFEH